MLPEFTFTLPAKMDLSKATGEGGRYPTDRVLAFAGLHEDEMTTHLAATDGRILAVVPCTGSTPPMNPVLIPGKACKALANSAATVSVNGEVRVTTGTRSKKTAVLPNAEQEGRFPRIRSVVPSTNLEGRNYLRIDANLLANLAAAISEDGAVSLYLPEPAEDGSITGVISVIGSHGIGLAVPLTISDDKQRAKHAESERERFRATVDALPMNHLSFPLHTK